MSRERRMLRRTLLVLLSLTLLRWPVSAAVRMMLPDVSAAPAANYFAAMAQSLLLFALPGRLLMPRWVRKEQDNHDLWGELAPGLAAVLMCRAVVTPLQAVGAKLLGAETTPIFVPADGPVQMLAILALAVMPAVCEELFFRGAVLPRLLQCASRWQAVLLTTLLFALMHGSLAGVAGHLLSGLLFSLVMLQTGRVEIPMLLHLFYNLSALVWPETPWWVPVFGAVVLLALLWRLIRRAPRGQERQICLSDALLCAAVLGVMAVQYLM